MSSAEHVVAVGQIARKIEEASAKGFRNKPAMELLYSLESALDDLLVAATREYLASEVGA
ncbi:hypothetical protein SAMN05443245_5223 [Paraburkholderia fungorum]|uniref:Uncharacterized protein n=1 Tax=Paraburkholderia fungorum TaxID=134537 RepID=A0A1H1IJC9_9BURK|nr:hypothetical protein [Paraburkholderia fungorum]SDR37426.1 hypothetical protein SAMN05443245_5223 [Paraburkholderia fungorum]